MKGNVKKQQKATKKPQEASIKSFNQKTADFFDETGKSFLLYQ